MDVDAQVVAEPSISGGQGRPAQPRERRCVVCGKPEQNARTYQTVIETSGKDYSNWF